MEQWAQFNHYCTYQIGQGIRETEKGVKRETNTPNGAKHTAQEPPPPLDREGGEGGQVGQPDTSRGGISVLSPTALLPLVNSAKTPIVFR